MKDTITGKTKLLGLLGHPVEHSLSPVMHNKGFQNLNLDFIYLCFDIKEESLNEAVQGLKAIGVRGFNVTMPHKKTIIQYLDGMSKEAELIGAVNTVVNDAGKLYGHNTDGKGYVRALVEEGISVKDKTIVMFGAGGASRSISVELALAGAKEIVIINRTVHKAVEICNMLNRNIPTCKTQAKELNDENTREAIERADILINNTSLGMHPYEDQCIIKDENLLRADLIVSDLIYEPSKTALLKMAEKKGCKIINGLGMLVWQGALAFELWTGKKMPIDEIKQKLLKERMHL